MGSVNKAILVGRVGKDPEIRTMNSGDRVASFSLATSEVWRDKSSGERKEKTAWHNVVVFNEHLVKVVENHVAKGSQIYVEGAIQTRKYEKDGVERYTTEIVLQRFNGELSLLGGGHGGNAGADEGGSGGLSGDDYSGGFARGSGPKDSFDLDDEIPF